MQSVLVTLGWDYDFIHRNDIRFAIMMGTALLFIFPLCLLRTLSGFRYISLIILFAVVYVCLALLYELPAYYDANY